MGSADAPPTAGMPGERSRAGGDAEAGPSAGEAADEPRGDITVQPWSPDTPYLRAIGAAAPEAVYAAYLAERPSYRRSPAFYLDVATLLYAAARPAEARRVLTNIAELGLADARLLRIVGYKLQEAGDLDLAIRLFEEVRALRPEEPQSQRDLALALADRADRVAAAEPGDPSAPMADWVRAVTLLEEVISGDAGRFDQIQLPALHEVNRIIARMERYAEAELGGAEAVPDLPLDERLRRNLELDLRVLLRWDTDLTDMDLWVDEPTGERAYYGNRSTGLGGLFGRDYTQGYGPEEYVLRRAPEGTFTVQANFFGSRQQALTGGTTLQVDIFTDYGRPTERRQTATVRLTSRGETVQIGDVRFGDDGAPDFDLSDRVQVSAGP